MKKIKISPLFIIWIVFLIKFQSTFVLPLLCAVSLHELGHLTVAKILKIKIKCFRLSILGARIETEESLSYTNEFLLAAGGPFFGLLGFAFVFPYTWQYPTDSSIQSFWLPFSIISLCLTLFNLIPLSSLDGGRMAFCLMCQIFSLRFALKIIRISSFLTLFSFWIFSVYMMIKISMGLSMLVFCGIFFAKCFIFDIKNGDIVSF
jgi:stage IV sporulation protein FB